MYFDTAAFCGHWPYHHLRDSDVQQMLARYHAAGIDAGLMSSLDAVFYQDPWEADGPLVAALAGTNWRVAMSLNPMMPWAQQLIAQGKNAGVAAVRLYPCVHDYAVDDPQVVALCRRAGELGLPVILTTRMLDDRVCYLLKQRETEAERIVNLVRQCENTRFLVSNATARGVLDLAPVPENLWVDTAGQRIDGFVETQTDVPLDRFLFGSFAPLQCIRSSRHLIPQELRQQVMCDNVRTFFEG